MINAILTNNEATAQFYADAVSNGVDPQALRDGAKEIAEAIEAAIAKAKTKGDAPVLLGFNDGAEWVFFTEDGTPTREIEDAGVYASAKEAVANLADNPMNIPVLFVANAYKAVEMMEVVLGRFTPLLDVQFLTEPETWVA